MMKCSFISCGGGAHAARKSFAGAKSKFWWHQKILVNSKLTDFILSFQFFALNTVTQLHQCPFAIVRSNSLLIFGRALVFLSFSWNIFAIKKNFETHISKLKNGERKQRLKENWTKITHTFLLWNEQCVCGIFCVVYENKRCRQLLNTCCWFWPFVRCYFHIHFSFMYMPCNAI